MIRTIRLYGRLKKKFGPYFRLDVETAAEAIQALTTIVPGFREEVEKGAYKFVRGNRQTGLLMHHAEPLHLGLGNISEMHLIPATANRGRGFGQIILGAVLIGVSFIPGLGQIAGVAISTILFSAGVSMVLSGIATLLTPTVKSKKAKNDESFLFDGPDNVSVQGVAVPITYGIVMAGSVVISAGLDVEQILSRGGRFGLGKGGEGGSGGEVGDGGLPSFAAPNPADIEEDGYADWDDIEVILAGGGGKGGGGGTPEEAPNSLKSNSTARMVDLISEGPCIGLIDQANKLKSVYFDDVVVQNADGTFNFKGLKMEQRVGNPDDDPIPGFTAAENEVAVTTQVTTVTPVVRAITDTDVDDVRITVSIPSLFKVDEDDGDIRGTSVRFAVDISEDGGAYENVLTTSISGKTNTEYQRAYRIELPGEGPWSLRMRRITDDSEETTLQNDLFWTSYTEIINAKLIYPNSAHIGLTFDAQQFGSHLPRRSFLWGGRIISIPTNYDPVQRTYATSGPGTTGGIWDGTFKQEWSNNPAWVLYDLLTHERYGLGLDVDGAMPNKWLLYEISQYCDGMLDRGLGTESVSSLTQSAGTATATCSDHDLRVGNYVTIAGATPAGYNGTFMVESVNGSQFTFSVSSGLSSPATGTITALPVEPRYTINTQIVDRGEAWELLQNIISVFRGMLYWGAGSIEFSYDHDESPTKIVTRANVVNGELNYSTDSFRGRHSAVAVAWNDPELNYRANYEIIEDRDLIDSLGYRLLETTAWGCSSRSQAHRMGRWILDTERYAELLTYVAGLDHADVRPGSVIEVNDPEYTSTRFGGRLRAVSGTTLTLDDAVDLDGAASAWIKVVLPDGTVEEQEIDTVATGVDDPTVTIELLAPLSVTPVGAALFSIRTDEVTPRLFRVIGVTESSPYEFTVTAIYHDPNKFDRVERGLDLPPNNFSNIPLNTQLLPPSDVTLTDALIREGDTARPGALLSWSVAQDARVRFYEWQVKESVEEDWGVARRTLRTSDTFEGVRATDYDARVRSCNDIGMKSQWAVREDITLSGTQGAIAAVTGLTTQQLDDATTTVLRWNPQAGTETRPLQYEVLYHASSSTFGDAVSLGRTSSLEFPIAQTGNYWVRGVFGSTTGTETMITYDPEATVPDDATVVTLLEWTDRIVVSTTPISRAKTYVWGFYLSDGTTLKRTIVTIVPQVEYTKAQAHADGVARDYKIEVAGENAAGTGTAFMSATISNAAPAAPTSVTFADGTSTSTVTFTPSASSDAVGHLVAYATSSSFDPMTQGASFKVISSPAYTTQLPATTYYGKVASYDLWSSQPDQINFSSEDTFVITPGSGGDPPPGDGGGGFGGGGGGGGGGGHEF